MMFVNEDIVLELDGLFIKIIMTLIVGAIESISFKYV
jgi:hypothetical protein